MFSYSECRNIWPIVIEHLYSNSECDPRVCSRPGSSSHWANVFFAAIRLGYCRTIKLRAWMHNDWCCFGWMWYRKLVSKLSWPHIVPIWQPLKHEREINWYIHYPFLSAILNLGPDICCSMYLKTVSGCINFSVVKLEFEMYLLSLKHIRGVRRNRKRLALVIWYVYKVSGLMTHFSLQHSICRIFKFNHLRRSTWS